MPRTGARSECVCVCLCVAGGGTALLDLSGLDTSPQSPPSFPEFPTPTDSLNATSQEMGLSLLDDELMSLGDHDKATRGRTQDPS